MSLELTPQEKKIAQRLAEVKKASGSHSPSPAMLEEAGIILKHDFCYLSNPYATELFLRYFRKDFTSLKKLKDLVEHYPSQNRALAQKLTHAPFLRGITERNLFVGNGATEIIQAVLQTFTKKKMLVPIPTFSPYLEFAPKSVRVVHHRLQKKNGFRLDLGALLAQVKQEKPDTVVIINPNNPDGGYHSANELQSVLPALKGVETIIVDESFIHFAKRRIESMAHLVRAYPNLIIIKSLSKDFGIAGLRLGYAVMSEKRVSALLARGYLWNVSGFGEYFLDLLNNEKFLGDYEKARLRAIKDRDAFFAKLSRIQGIRVYPSQANFFLIELVNGFLAQDLMVALLCRFGIYIRPCTDKTGLIGEFVRIAPRTAKEDVRLIQALKNILSE